MAKRFTIRVYGLLLHNQAVLVSDEYIRQTKITKFPGGGLEFGEGIADCLLREFQEELNLQIKISAHFYTTDFFVPSFLDPDIQVISVYYLVTAVSDFNFHTSDILHNHHHSEGAQAFRWIPLSQLKEDDLTLVIDRKVAGMLKEKAHTK